MTPTEQVMWWVVLLLGMVGAAIYSGLETGFYRLNRVKLEVRAERGPNRRAARRLKSECATPQRTLASTLVATIVAGDLAASGASNLLSGAGYSDGAVVLINVAVLTPVFFVFLESIPKELFRLEADSLMYRFAFLLTGARTVFTATGILPLVRRIAALILHRLGPEQGSELAYSGRERLATMIKDTAGEREEAAPLTESQARLVDRALEFGRTSVADEMLPWLRVRTAQASWNRSTLVTLLAREPRSFLPVVERDAAGKVRVIGVLRNSDLFTRPDAPVSRLILEPARVPPRMSLREAIVKLGQAQATVGIVEEGGKPIGLISMADLIEPLLRGQEG
jgi:CBS domain containing-hemolysin-like protein